VKDPREALEAARRAAAARAADAPPDDDGPAAPGSAFVSARRLSEWAIIEPERAQVYSTRRLGQPITWLKRLLIRLLNQYLGQMSAQQSRFNAHIAAHVLRLEERVRELEQAARGDEPPSP
jgi:hypothetical protein